MAVEQIIGGLVENAVGEVELRRVIKPDREGWYWLRPGIQLWTVGALVQLGFIVCVVAVVVATPLLVQVIALALTVPFGLGSYWTWLACNSRMRWKGTELSLVPTLSPEISTTFCEVVRLTAPNGLLRWHIIEFADGRRYRFSSRLRGTPQLIAQLDPKSLAIV